MAPGKEVKGVLETFAHSQTPSGTPEPIEPKKEEAGKVGEPAAKVAEKPAEKGGGDGRATGELTAKSSFAGSARRCMLRGSMR